MRRAGTKTSIGLTALVLLQFASAAWSQNNIRVLEVKNAVCPPKGDPYKEVIVENLTTHKMVEANQILKFDNGEDINNDGKKDRLLTTDTDLAGNSVEQWCLQKSDKTPQRFALAFVPNPNGGAKKRLWFGGCYFDDADNSRKVSGKVDEDKGKVKEFTEVIYHNREYKYDKEKEKPTGTNDKHFYYFNAGADKGKIRLDITTGMWKKEKGEWVYNTTNTDMGKPMDPPGLPQNLRAAAPTPFSPGVDIATALVLTNSFSGPTWSYSLYINPSFSWDAGVLITPSVHIDAGDQLVLAGQGITNAYVAGDALSPSFGGWVVANSDSQHVTFEATSSVDVLPDLPFGGFNLVSTYSSGGAVAWTYSGTEIGTSQETWGPVSPGEGDQ